MNQPEWNRAFTRREWLGGALALGAGAALPFPAWAQAPAAWPSVARLAADYVAQRKVANVVAAMGWGQQPPSVVAAGTLALRTGPPADADSLYRWYSMTKPITGMAAMILIDEGKLGLDQPLADILPRFRTMRVQKVYDGSIAPDNLEPAARPITIRMLLTHSAGLGYQIIQQGPLHQAYMDRGLLAAMATRLPLSQFIVQHPAPGLAAFADRIAELPLVYQPGTHWSYSAGLDVMGRVIEVVSGRRFDTFLQERILGPCGMTSTWFQVPQSQAGRLTTNYGVLAELLIPIDMPDTSVFLDPPPVLLGGGGLVGSPRDYDRFLKMLAGFGRIDGKRVMSEAAVRMGTSNLLPETVTASGHGGGVSLDLARYGFGAGGRVGKAAEEGVYGWAGAAGTVAFVDVRRGLRGGLFTQYMPDTAYPLRDQFIKAVTADALAAALKSAA